MKRRALVLALALALLAGCTPGEVEATATPEPAPSLEPVPAAVDNPFALPRTEESMHPILTRDSVNLALSGLVWEGLFALDRDFQPQPVLCESYSVSEDGLVWTFTLKGGAVFSDGSPLTAQEAADSLNLARSEKSRYAGRLAGVKAVQAEEGAVTVTLAAPNGALPSLLDVPIVKGETEEPLGTGPYAVEGWGEDCRLVAHAAWWSGRGAEPPAASIPLRTVREADDLIYAFDTGNISLVTADLTGSNALGFSGDHEVWDYPTTTLVYVGFNCASGPCADPLVRRGLSRGFDRNTVAVALYARHAQAAALPVHPGSELYSRTAAAELDYAPQSMAQLLAEAGYEKNDQGVLAKGRRELELTLAVNTDNSFRVAVADYLAGELERAGCRVEVEKLSWADYQKALSAGDFDLYLGAAVMTADFDPTALISGGLNYGKYWSAETNGLAEAFRAASGQGRRDAAQALYENLAQEVPFAALCFKNQSVLTQWGAVSGLNPTQQNPFYGIEGWEMG